MKSEITPGKIRTAVSVLTILFALPLGWKGATGIFIWLSPFIMLNSVIVLKSFVILNMAGIIVLLISFFRKRFFCRYLCPAGLCLDKVSQASRFKAGFHRKMPQAASIPALISIASAFTGIPLLILLDPQAMVHGFISVFSGKTGIAALVSLSGFPLLLLISYFFPNMWCGKICPLGGLQDLASESRSFFLKFRRTRAVKDDVSVYLPARRYFISAGAGLAAGALIPGILKPSSPEKWIRPPGSIDNDSFNALCIRCGNCIKSCPAHILVNHFDLSDLSSWMTPEVVFTDSYCLEKCNICSQACPTGSITLFSREAKDRVFMGIAEVLFDECLLAKNRECDRCKAVCSYDAVEITRKNGSMTMLPYIDSGRCAGCGACKVICPAAAIKILPPAAG